MNTSARFYAITTALGAIITATLPAEAAMFSIGGTGTAQNGQEQTLSGTFNDTLTDFRFSVRSPGLTGGSPYVDVDSPLLAGLIPEGFNSTDNFDTRNIYRSFTYFGGLNIFSENTLKVDLSNFQPGDTKSVFWQQFGVINVPPNTGFDRFGVDPRNYNTAGFGTATISMIAEPIPEPSEILGVAGAGAMLLGAAFFKRRKIVKG